MAWSTTPGGRKVDSSATMEKAQQWQPSRRRQLSDPSVFQQKRRTSVFRGKRGVATLTALLLVAIVLVTTMTMRPTYRASAIQKIQNLGKWKDISKWKAAEAKLMGHWSHWEESQDFQTTNPQMVSASSDKISSGMREPHRALANPEILAEAVEHRIEDAKPKEETKWTESTLDRNQALDGIGSGQNFRPVPETESTLDEDSPATDGIAS